MSSRFRYLSAQALRQMQAKNLKFDRRFRSVMYVGLAVIVGCTVVDTVYNSQKQENRNATIAKLAAAPAKGD